MTRLSEYPAFIELDALSLDGADTPAFRKLLDASDGFSREALAWMAAFVEEYVAHHKHPDTGLMTPACKSALRRFPKYKKNRVV